MINKTLQLASHLAIRSQIACRVPRVTVALFVTLLCASFATSAAAAPASDDAQPWYLGKDLIPRDYFTYKICANHVIAFANGSCFVVTLEFVDILYGWNGPVWIVQAKFASSEGSDPAWQDAILQIRPGGQLPVASGPHHRSPSSIIEDTLFWIGTYASTDRPQDLRIGSHWGDVLSNRLYVSSVEMGTINGAPAEVITVAYQGSQKESNIQIIDGLPFPIQAKVYLPLGRSVISQLQYEFQLLDYGSAGSGSTMAHSGKTGSELNSPTLDPQEAVSFISRVCQIDPETYSADHSIAEMCAGALLGPSLSDEAAHTQDRLVHDHNACTGELSEEMCYSGSVTMVESDAISVNGNRVRLSFVSAYASDAAQEAATLYLESECAIGSWATVDIDDLQQPGVGAVYCQSDTPVNAILIAQNLTLADPFECDLSEFTSHDWTKRVCDA